MENNEINEFPYNLMRIVMGISPDDDLGLMTGKKTLIELLTECNPREYGILLHRYFSHETLEETGTHYGIGKERVRQIEAKAIHKLQRCYGSCERTPSRREFIDLMNAYRNLEHNNGMLRIKLKEEESRNIFRKKIWEPDMDFDTRVWTVLGKYGIETIEDIIKFDDTQMDDDHNNIAETWLGMRNMGKGTLRKLATRVYDLCGHRIKIPHVDEKGNVTYSFVEFEEE